MQYSFGMRSLRTTENSMGLNQGNSVPSKSSRSLTWIRSVSTFTIHLKPVKTRKEMHTPREAIYNCGAEVLSRKRSRKRAYPPGEHSCPIGVVKYTRAEPCLQIIAKKSLKAKKYKQVIDIQLYSENLRNSLESNAGSWGYA